MSASGFTNLYMPCPSITGDRSRPNVRLGPAHFPQFRRQAGSTSLLIHWEGNNNLHRTAQGINGLEKRAGMAINLATPAALLEEILADLDQVLVR